MRRRSVDLRFKPLPTAAPKVTRDLIEATLYRQSWRHREGVMLSSFDVLAFPDDVEDQGYYRLSGMGFDGAAMQIVASVAEPEASIDRKLAVLAVEDPEEGEIRRRAWARIENGPDAEPTYDGGGRSHQAEQMDRAYQVDRSQR